MYQAIFLGDDFLTMSVRIFIAAILSGLVGIEREVKKHPAGFRTHLLVGIGSCLMMLLSLYGFEPYINENSNIRFDPARIPSYVISGIGFLGAGTILVRGASIRGLTTAASIWVVAGLGLIVGVGMYAPAILTTVVVLLSLIFLNKFESKFIKTRYHSLHIVVNRENKGLVQIINKLEEKRINVQRFQVEDYVDEDMNELLTQYVLDINLPEKKEIAILFEELHKLKGVVKIF